MPGMCLLVRRWFDEALLPSFRELPGVQLQLSNWFENPRVAVYLKVCVGRGGSNCCYKQSAGVEERRGGREANAGRRGGEGERQTRGGEAGRERGKSGEERWGGREATRVRAKGRTG
eukprot:365242-Chlamydomonas_euryale.AAC.6